MKVIILGCGYTGKHLLNFYPNAMCTELPELCNDNQIPFDFNNTDTWNNLPEFDLAIITFKMLDPEKSKDFATLLKNKKVILLSSARNLKNTKADEIINEQSQLKDNARAHAESFFSDFSMIFYLGLIYGPGRDPARWFSENRIKNGRKLINIIHVEDLCRIIVILVDNFNTGSLLVSDGKPVRWSKIASSMGFKLKEHPPALESRYFDTTQLNSLLPEDFVFRSVY